MIHSNERIIKHKVRLLNLAEELCNVSQACKVMGLTHLLTLVVFAAFNGLVFYSIQDLSHPFSGAGAIRPTAYERLFQEDMFQSAPPLR